MFFFIFFFEIESRFNRLSTIKNHLSISKLKELIRCCGCKSRQNIELHKRFLKLFFDYFAMDWFLKTWFCVFLIFLIALGDYFVFQDFTAFDIPS